MNIPLIDLKRQYAPLKSEIMSVFERLIDTGNFILGKEVSDFESEIATYLGSKYAIGVTSGTDALWLSLKALGIGNGDRVLTTPFTFFATISAIKNAGAEPVFADIDSETFNLDPAEVERVLASDNEKNIKAILPVHLYGQSADMEKLIALGKRYQVAVVEDAAQAIGTTYSGKKVGTLGAFGNYSFYPTKNLGAMGDAGLLVTQDEALYRRAHRLRTHGESSKYYHAEIGSNCRIDALQAGVLRVCLQHLEPWIKKRQNIAGFYNEGLKNCSDRIVSPKQEAWSNHTFHQYTIRVLNSQRNQLQDFLKKKNIASLTYYPVPCHLQEALRPMGFKVGMYPKSEAAALEVLSLPVYPDMHPAEAEYVLNSLHEWCQSEMR